jgi:peptide/nickel transport system substrate-binding protein
MISHFKEIYINGELDLVDTALWYPKLARKDFTVGFVPMESGVDDPNQGLYEDYTCGAEGN